MSWTYTLNPNWPHTVDCGEDELVVSQTPVELVGAFLQKVDGHLNSLWSKQFLCAAGCLQFKNLSTLTYNSHRTVALGLIISALPFCAYRFHTALKVSVEYPTLSPLWRHHPHQSLLPFALKSLGKHNREVRIEHIYQVESFCSRVSQSLPKSWLMVPWSQRSCLTESSPEDATDLSTLIQRCIWAFLLPRPLAGTLLPWQWWASGRHEKISIIVRFNWQLRKHCEWITVSNNFWL